MSCLLHSGGSPCYQKLEASRGYRWTSPWYSNHAHCTAPSKAAITPHTSTLWSFFIAFDPINAYWHFSSLIHSVNGTFSNENREKKQSFSRVHKQLVSGTLVFSEPTIFFFPGPFQHWCDSAADRGHETTEAVLCSRPELSAHTRSLLISACFWFQRCILLRYFSESASPIWADLWAAEGWKVLLKVRLISLQMTAHRTATSYTGHSSKCCHCVW